MYRKNAATERKIVVVIFILFLNLILMSTNIILKNEKSLFQNIISSFFTPFQVGFQKTIDFISYEVRHYIFLKNMFRKYYDLKKKHRDLKYENYLLRKELLKSEFVSKIKSRNKNFIETEVISVDNNFPFNSIFINKGSKHGIKNNMILLNEDGELVGRIINPIAFFSSKVRLITSPIGGVGAYIQKNELEGLLKGNNNSICNFKYLIENVPVNISDVVITSGTDQIFPSHIPIGRVVGVKKEYLTQKVFVKPFFVEKSIKKLIIIKNDDQSNSP